jgi:uncharacterized protein (TIGR04255 family)
MTTPYACPPVVLALFEVRHLETPLGEPELALAKARLRDLAPLHRVDKVLQVVGQLNIKATEPPHMETRSADVHRFFTRQRDLSISYAPTRLTVELSNYQGWPNFRAAVRQALEARRSGPDCSDLDIDGIERVGLRYLDEIRVPGAPDTIQWSQWVAQQLLPSEPPAGFTWLQQQAVVQYGVNSDHHSLALRYGLVTGPSSFNSTPYLTRPDPGSGSYFLLDTDASWTSQPGESLLTPQADSLLDLASLLHSPASALFESLITDKLRNEVLGRG